MEKNEALSIVRSIIEKYFDHFFSKTQKTKVYPKKKSMGREFSTHQIFLTQTGSQHLTHR